MSFCYERCGVKSEPMQVTSYEIAEKASRVISDESHPKTRSKLNLISRNGETHMPENSLTFTISAQSADELAVLMRRIAQAIDGSPASSEATAENVEPSGEPEADWYRLNAS